MTERQRKGLEKLRAGTRGGALLHIRDALNPAVVSRFSARSLLALSAVLESVWLVSR